MIEKINVGYVVKPQGVMGELKVEPLTDDANRFKTLKKVYVDEKCYEITHARVSNGVVFVRLFGVNDRNTAELFRNKYFVIDREDAVVLKENSFFIADLIGSTLVFVDGEKLGVICDVTSAKTDFFTAKTVDGRIVRFPHLIKVVKSVDTQNSIVTLDKKSFLEVCVYED